MTSRTDSHPSTKYNWLRTSDVRRFSPFSLCGHSQPQQLLGFSEVSITWDIESDAPAGTYRIVYYGDYKNGWTGAIVPFTGTSNTFTVS